VISFDKFFTLVVRISFYLKANAFMTFLIMVISSNSPVSGVGNLFRTVRRLKVLNCSVCSEKTYFYTSQGQNSFCVNHNKIDM